MKGNLLTRQSYFGSHIATVVEVTLEIWHLKYMIKMKNICKIISAMRTEAELVKVVSKGKLYLVCDSSLVIRELCEHRC